MTNNNKETELDKQDSAEVKNYTRTPNMLIFGYHDTISPQEKWLYVCLKHLCGKKGTRHLSLRYISEKTGISVGALSKSKDKKGNINEGMIKHLHDAGLIHAEIKQRNGKGNPLYHITITDVWGLNQEFFSKTRPNSEQDEDEENEPVRNSDVPVQNSDKLARNSDKPVQISDEPVRKPLQYQDYIQDYNQDDNTNTRKQERESTASESDAPTVSPPDVGALTLPSKTEEFIEKLREWRIEDEQQGDAHGYANNDLADLALDHAQHLPGMPASREDEQAPVTEGDAHVDIPPGSADRADTLPSADMGDLPASGQDLRLAAPARRPVVPTGQEKIGDNHAVVATHTPGGGDTARSVDHRPEQAVREAVHGEAVSKKGQVEGQLEQNTSTPMPAQTTPPTSEQAASGQELVTHCYLCGELVSREPVPGPLVCESCKRKAKQEPKWNVAAMVAEAERLREKPFSAIARPKETKKAQALFKRKPDLTQEEFEAAWRHWATPWWHENNGLFTLTDLAATPKNKSEMRLIIALEKLERGKPPLFTVPKQSTFVPRPSKIEVPDDFILSAYSYH